MVTILRRPVLEVVCSIKKLQIFNEMAWRSTGTDNADLINQLEGKFSMVKKISIGNSNTLI